MRPVFVDCLVRNHPLAITTGAWMLNLMMVLFELGKTVHGRTPSDVIIPGQIVIHFVFCEPRIGRGSGRARHEFGAFATLPGLVLVPVFHAHQFNSRMSPLKLQCSPSPNHTMDSGSHCLSAEIG